MEIVFSEEVLKEHKKYLTDKIIDLAYEIDDLEDSEKADDLSDEYVDKVFELGCITKEMIMVDRQLIELEESAESAEGSGQQSKNNTVSL